MESKKKGKTPLLCLLLVVLLSQEVVTLAMSRKKVIEGDLNGQKNYYTPDPHGGSPTHSHKSPYQAPPHSGGSASTRNPLTPSHGSSRGSYNPPSPPSITRSPTPPATPFDPNTPPFTCDYWRTHPTAIWTLFGYWGTVGQFFGPGAASAFGRNASLLEALGNPRTDSIGALYREGTASFLNSLATKTFVFTPQQVKDAFNAALVSDKASAAQAQLFKNANEGHLKHH